MENKSQKNKKEIRIARLVTLHNFRYFLEYEKKHPRITNRLRLLISREDYVKFEYESRRLLSFVDERRSDDYNGPIKIMDQ